MKKLAALIVVGMLLGSTSVMAYEYKQEPRGKLLMMVSTNTNSSGPDLEVLVNFTDFDTMSECANAVWLLTNAKSVTMPINGTQVPGQVLPSKVGTQGNAVTYTYRCLPYGYDRMAY